MAKTHFRSQIDVNSLIVNSSLAIPTAAIKSSHIGTDVVVAADIATGAVGSAELATAAVVNVKIADATVGLGAGTHQAAAGKLDAAYLSMVTATADVENTVAHGMSGTPIAFAVLDQDKAGAWYASNNDGTNFKVKCDVATVTAKLLLW